jgi:hypothetical protein
MLLLLVLLLPSFKSPRSEAIYYISGGLEGSCEVCTVCCFNLHLRAAWD